MCHLCPGHASWNVFERNRRWGIFVCRGAETADRNSQRSADPRSASDVSARRQGSSLRQQVRPAKRAQVFGQTLAGPALMVADADPGQTRHVMTLSKFLVIAAAA